jgi:hypothetical protein
MSDAAMPEERCAAVPAPGGEPQPAAAESPADEVTEIDGRIHTLRRRRQELLSTTSPPPAGWYPDVLRRHPYRYWGGLAWTKWVARDGRLLIDPPHHTPPRHSGDRRRRTRASCRSPCSKPHLRPSGPSHQRRGSRNSPARGARATR